MAFLKNTGIAQLEQVDALSLLTRGSRRKVKQPSCHPAEHKHREVG
jgi:hypothetical protein